MFKQMISDFKSVDNKILKIIKVGLSFSFFVCIVATLILCTYILFYSNPIFYLAGFYCLKLGIILGIEFIICGFAVDLILR